MKDVFYLSLVQFFYDLLTRTQKYIKPPPKLHDTDHAPNVADIATRFIDLITKAKQEQLLDSNQKVITVNGNLPNNKFQVFISNLTLEDLYNNDYHIYKATNVTATTPFSLNSRAVVFDFVFVLFAEIQMATRATMR